MRLAFPSAEKSENPPVTATQNQLSLPFYTCIFESISVDQSPKKHITFGARNATRRECRITLLSMICANILCFAIMTWMADSGIVMSTSPVSTRFGQGVEHAVEWMAGKETRAGSPRANQATLARRCRVSCSLSSWWRQESPKLVR